MICIEKPRDQHVDATKPCIKFSSSHKSSTLPTSCFTVCSLHSMSWEPWLPRVAKTQPTRIGELPAASKDEWQTQIGRVTRRTGEIKCWTGSPAAGDLNGGVGMQASGKVIIYWLRFAMPNHKGCREKWEYFDKADSFIVPPFSIASCHFSFRFLVTENWSSSQPNKWLRYHLHSARLFY